MSLSSGGEGVRERAEEKEKGGCRARWARMVCSDVVWPRITACSGRGNAQLSIPNSSVEGGEPSEEVDAT